MLMSLTGYWITVSILLAACIFIGLEAMNIRNSGIHYDRDFVAISIRVCIGMILAIVWFTIDQFVI